MQRGTDGGIGVGLHAPIGAQVAMLGAAVEESRLGWGLEKAITRRRAWGGVKGR